MQTLEDRASTTRAVRETLVAADEASERLIDECLDSWPEDAGTLWYPSAGRDLRDLLEFRSPRLESHGFTVRPHLFIHTDVPQWPEERVELPTHVDRRTRIRPVRGAWLRMVPEVAETVGLGDALGEAAREPERAVLLDVQVRSDRGGTYRAWLLDLRMSNYDFFVRYVVERGLRFSSLVQVRQGVGLGGCGLDLSALTPWLAWAGCRQLIGDGEYHGHRSEPSRPRDAAHAAILAAGAPADPPCFSVEHRERGLCWSNLPCDASTITPEPMSVPLDAAVPLACSRLVHPASRFPGLAGPR